MSKTKLPVSAGKAGAGAVDLFSGGLEYTLPLADFKGSLDWGINLVYNPKMSESIKNLSGGLLFNSQWKINLVQILLQKPENAYDKAYTRIYIDAAGNEHSLYKYKDDSDYTYYTDYEGLGLNLAMQKSANNYGKMTDAYGNIYTFDSGILREITSGSKKIIINYSDGKYNSFVDNNGNGILFPMYYSDRLEIKRNGTIEKTLYTDFSDSVLKGLYSDMKRENPEITFEYDVKKPSKIGCGGEELSLSYTGGKVTQIKTKTGGIEFNTSINYLSHKTIVTDPMGVAAVYIMNNDGETICHYEEINGEPAGIVEYAKTVDNFTVAASVPAAPSDDSLIYCLPYGGAAEISAQGLDKDRIYTLYSRQNGGDESSGLTAAVSYSDGAIFNYTCNFESGVSGAQFAVAAFKLDPKKIAEKITIQSFGPGTFTNVCLYKGGAYTVNEVLAREHYYEPSMDGDEGSTVETEFKFSQVKKIFSDGLYYPGDLNIPDYIFTKEDYIKMSQMLQKKARYISLSCVELMFFRAADTFSGAVLCYNKGYYDDSVNLTATRLKILVTADYADTVTYTKFIPGQDNLISEQTIIYNGQEFKSYSDGATQTDPRGIKCKLQKTQNSDNSEMTQTQVYTSADSLSIGLKTTTVSDEKGTTVKSYDARGYHSETKYDAYGKPVHFMNPIVADSFNDEKISYSDNGFSANVKGRNRDFDETVRANGTSYNITDNRVTKLAHNNTDFLLEYDALGNITKATAGGAVLLDKSYKLDLANHCSTETSRFNGVESVLRHDKYGRLISSAENGAPVQTNVYGISASGNLEKHTDHTTNSEHVFSYDGDGDIKALTVKDKSSGAVKSEVTFAKTKDKVTGARFDIGGQKVNYSYAYDNYPEARLTKTEVKDKFATEISYDSFGRITSKTLTNAKNNNTIYKEAYTYIANGSDTTPYVEKIDFNNGASSFSYTYDKNGNITGISGAESKTYGYDTLNRLTKDNGTEYAYDGGGNRIAKKTNGELAEYSYDGDKLTFIEDEHLGEFGLAIDYDAAGNPLSYLGANLSWTRGRMLQSYSYNVVNAPSIVPLNVNFCYDASGLRTSKSYSVNGESTVHTYTYIGGQLMREQVRKAKAETLYSGGTYCSDTAHCGAVTISDSSTPIQTEAVGITDLTYHYDQTGIAGFTHKKLFTETDYYFRKNLQGDVIEIYNENGSLVAAYSYDAWGNCSIIHSTGGIAELNPTRYRGYYYDSETKLYYLKSRYYDPIIGRFINADDVKYALAQSEQLNGLNLFAYCLNNPVMYLDNNGTSVESIIISFLKIGYSIFKFIMNAASTSGKEVLLLLNKSQHLVQKDFLAVSINSREAIESYTKIWGRIFAITAFAYGSAMYIYNNFSNQNLSLDRKITDTIVDISLLGLSLLSFPVAIFNLGTGVLDSSGLSEKLFGKTILQDIKDSFSWVITDMIPSIPKNIKEIGKEISAWIYSWHWWW